MKLRHFVFICFISITFFGCQTNDEVNEKTILGTWKLTEAFISSGGPQYWVSVDDGSTFTFSEGGNFTSDIYSECALGVFDLDVDFTELKLQYSCNGFTSGAENSEGFITYTIEEINNNYIIVTPTSGPICIEGCSYKFSKI